MGSYIAQREMYLEKALLLRKEGMGSRRISRIIPVPIKTISGWIIKFAPETRNTPIAMKKQQPQTTSVAVNDSEDVRALQKRVKELEAQLFKSEIKAEAYDEMINVAEAKFNIPIRKKAGAKQ